MGAEVPDRVWLDQWKGGDWSEGLWHVPQRFPGELEYVSASALAAAVREAKAEALREALAAIAAERDEWVLVCNNPRDRLKTLEIAEDRIRTLIPGGSHDR